MSVASALSLSDNDMKEEQRDLTDQGEMINWLTFRQRSQLWLDRFLNSSGTRRRFCGLSAVTVVSASGFQVRTTMALF
jgi:hypothetical protein